MGVVPLGSHHISDAPNHWVSVSTCQTSKKGTLQQRNGAAAARVLVHISQKKKHLQKRASFLHHLTKNKKTSKIFFSSVFLPIVIFRGVPERFIPFVVRTFTSLHPKMFKTKSLLRIFRLIQCTMQFCNPKLTINGSDCSLCR